jgi:hypothetical protein
MNNDIFNQLEKYLLLEKRLILRYKDFCEELLVFDNGFDDFENKEDILLKKISKIAIKLLDNTLKDTDYKLVLHKVLPIKSKLKFEIEKKENKNNDKRLTFLLQIVEDGFELEQL